MGILNRRFLFERSGVGLVRIYSTNVISRAIYMPKTVFSCIWYAYTLFGV